MHSLSCRLARLGIPGDSDLMMECLYQDFILMPFLINVTDRFWSKGSSSNQPLSIAIYD